MFFLSSLPSFTPAVTLIQKTPDANKFEIEIIQKTRHSTKGLIGCVCATHVWSDRWRADSPPIRRRRLWLRHNPRRRSGLRWRFWWPSPAEWILSPALLQEGRVRAEPLGKQCSSRSPGRRSWWRWQNTPEHSDPVSSQLSPLFCFQTRYFNLQLLPLRLKQQFSKMSSSSSNPPGLKGFIHIYIALVQKVSTAQCSLHGYWLKSPLNNSLILTNPQ